jgi:hypothetical protein
MSPNYDCNECIQWEHVRKRRWLPCAFMHNCMGLQRHWNPSSSSIQWGPTILTISIFFVIYGTLIGLSSVIGIYFPLIN